MKVVCIRVDEEREEIVYKRLVPVRRQLISLVIWIHGSKYKNNTDSRLYVTEIVVLPHVNLDCFNMIVSNNAI